MEKKSDRDKNTHSINVDTNNYWRYDEAEGRCTEALFT